MGNSLLSTWETPLRGDRYKLLLLERWLPMSKRKKSKKNKERKKKKCLPQRQVGKRKVGGGQERTEDFVDKICALVKGFVHGLGETQT